MNFKEGIPIFRQIVEDVKSKIVSGYYQPGQRIESVRDLASLYGVNPNTIQKALTEMEMSHLLRADGPNGRYITEDYLLIDTIKKETINQMVHDFVVQMKQIGISIEDTVALIQKFNEGDHYE